MTSTGKDDYDESDQQFQGLMKNLNLPPFKAYRTDFENLSYDQIVSFKEQIESQLTILFDVLKNKYHVELDTPLVTRDGFPRNDIDIVSIRLIRIRILRLRNDNKKLLLLLQDKLIQQFSTAAPSGNDFSTATESAQPIHTIPFALVKQVVVNGPAYSSGLREGDKLVLFDDDIDATNHNNLAELASRVGSKLNQPIPIQLIRGTGTMHINLTPAKWSGQGVLGCRLVPIK